MFKNAKNSKKQGDIGLTLAIAYYSKLGYTVSIPITDSQEYDLLVDDSITVLKVQVKTTTVKSKYGVYTVALRTMGGNQSYYTAKVLDASKIDLLFCVTEVGDLYSIPSTSIKGKSTMNLGKDLQEFKVII